MGGVVRPKRDMDLTQSLPDKVRQMALCRPLLVTVDGLASYMSAFRYTFHSKLPQQAGEMGRCKMVSWPDIYIVQVVKQREEGVRIDRLYTIIQGTIDRVEGLIQKTQGKGVINTAFIEMPPSSTDFSIDAAHSRLSATGRNFGGCFYNFFDFHHKIVPRVLGPE